MRSIIQHALNNYKKCKCPDKELAQHFFLNKKIIKSRLSDLAESGFPIHLTNTAVSQVEAVTRNPTKGSTTYDSKGRERVNTAP
jgi:hypothetical protein